LLTILLLPLSNYLSYHFEVTGTSEEGWPGGVTFGLHAEDCIRKVEGQTLPVIERDWNFIREKITPLVEFVAAKLL
jgi:hypothetical protein